MHGFCTSVRRQLCAHAAAVGSCLPSRPPLWSVAHAIHLQRTKASWGGACPLTWLLCHWMSPCCVAAGTNSRPPAGQSAWVPVLVPRAARTWCLAAFWGRAACLLRCSLPVVQRTGVLEEVREVRSAARAARMEKIRGWWDSRPGEGAWGGLPKPPVRPQRWPATTLQHPSLPASLAPGRRQF